MHIAVAATGLTHRGAFVAFGSAGDADTGFVDNAGAFAMRRRDENVVHASRNARMPQLPFQGTSFMHRRDNSQPTREEALLTGLLKSIIKSFFITKIAGMKLYDS